MFKGIKAKIGITILSFLLLVIALITATYFTAESQESDGVIINLAGRQRMLSQKMTKEALSYVKGKTDATDMLKTAKLFDSTLNGLINGNKKLNLPPTEEKSILTNLQEVKSLWTGIHQNIKLLASSPENKEALNFIIEKNLDLLDSMNKIVKQFEILSSSKINTLYIIQLSFFILSLFVTYFAFKLINKKIVSPILTINEVALKAAEGNTDVRISYRSDDEIGELAESFCTMIKNINETQQLLIDEKNSIQKKIEIAIEESEKQRAYLAENTKKMLETMEQVKNGDLTTQLKIENPNDNIGKLFAGFNSVIQNIRAMIRSIQDSVEATASASTEINSITSGIASGSREQSVRISETTEAVNDIAKAIFESNKNATEAKKASLQAGEIAQKGGEIVEETIETMNEIADIVSESAEIVIELGKNSDKIGNIAMVIDDIADQTNLLALNAAIEAARAGEQGRGFAVVADEVRKLADRTTQATKEIATIISQIQKDTTGAVNSMQKGTEEVELGKQKTQRAGVALNEIILSTKSAVELVTNVAEASEEEAAAVEQMSTSIESIRVVSQEAAEGMEQISLATDDLSKLTLQLQDLSNRFILSEEEKRNKNNYLTE